MFKTLDDIKSIFSFHYRGGAETYNEGTKEISQFPYWKVIFFNGSGLEMETPELPRTIIYELFYQSIQYFSIII